ARYCLDKMNQDLFDIEQQITRKEITEEEAKVLRKKVRSKVDYYGSMEGAANILLEIMVAFTVLYIIDVAGGIAVGILGRNMYWKDALYQYIMLSSGYLVLFVVPLFLTSLGFKTTKDK
ncbi:MAG: FHIPEP family type III secretion protein, partial [Treponema sp.]|nr:FHIPEP family type III secretion protein [Treponema sp.]